MKKKWEVNPEPGIGNSEINNRPDLLSDIQESVFQYWSVADLIRVIIPPFAIRYAQEDISLKDTRDLKILIILAVVLNNRAGERRGSVTNRPG